MDEEIELTNKNGIFKIEITENIIKLSNNDRKKEIEIQPDELFKIVYNYHLQQRIQIFDQIYNKKTTDTIHDFNQVYYKQNDNNYLQIVYSYTFRKKEKRLNEILTITIGSKKKRDLIKFKLYNSQIENMMERIQDLRKKKG